MSSGGRLLAIASSSSSFGSCTFDRGAKSPLRLVGVFVHPGGAEMLKQGPTPETAAGQGAEERDTFDRPVTRDEAEGDGV